MDKKDFTKPEMEIIDLGGEDIITTSSSASLPIGGTITTDTCDPIYGD